MLFVPDRPKILTLGSDAVCLTAFAAPVASDLLRLVQEISAASPFRRMATPGGKPMSVAMTNCGEAGWITDRRGYRYAPEDPLTGVAWPPMPNAFAELAARAAAEGGFAGFEPDVALINRYEQGTRMSLHQDRDERDFSQPIVSVSLGVPAIFLWGGQARTDKPRRIELFHGDVVVWGGTSRLNFHGILPVAAGEHDLTGAWRYNLTFRRAL